MRQVDGKHVCFLKDGVCLHQRPAASLPCPQPVEAHTDITMRMLIVQEGIRCLHLVATDSACNTPTIAGPSPWLGKFHYYNYTVDHEWINENAPEEAAWRGGPYGHHSHPSRL